MGKLSMDTLRPRGTSAALDSDVSGPMSSPRKAGTQARNWVPAFATLSRG